MTLPLTPGSSQVCPAQEQCRVTITDPLLSLNPRLGLETKCLCLVTLVPYLLTNLDTVCDIIKSPEWPPH